MAKRKRKKGSKRKTACLKRGKHNKCLKRAGSKRRRKGGSVKRRKTKCLKRGKRNKCLKRAKR